LGLGNLVVEDLEDTSKKGHREKSKVEVERGDRGGGDKKGKESCQAEASSP